MICVRKILKAQKHLSLFNCRCGTWCILSDFRQYRFAPCEPCEAPFLLTSVSLATVCCCKVRVSSLCCPGSCWHSTCRRHKVSHSLSARQHSYRSWFSVVRNTHLCDGEGLLLGVLTEADHKQHLRGEEQAASVLLTWPTHYGHLQGHVELRPTQRLEHLPVERKQAKRDVCYKQFITHNQILKIRPV